MYLSLRSFLSINEQANTKSQRLTVLTAYYDNTNCRALEPRIPNILRTISQFLCIRG